MTQPLIEYRMDLAGFSTRALELEGEGPPFLFLHGYADSADTWRLVLDRLARQGRRALAVDLPGFGAADRLARGEPILEQLGTFAASAVEHLARAADAPVVLAGNSLGGCVSLRAAQDRSLPIASVIPVAPAGFDHPLWFRAIESQPVLRTLLASPVPAPEAVVRRAVGVVYRQLAFATPVPGPVITAFTEYHRSRRDVRRYLATGRTLMAELRDPFRLGEIRVPVLLIWGDRDRMVTHRGARHVLAALPETRYELLRGVGHCPQVEVPDRFVELLGEFAPVG